MENSIEAWKLATLAYAKLEVTLAVFRLNAEQISHRRERLNSTIKNAERFSAELQKDPHYKETMEKYNGGKALVMNQGVILLDEIKQYRTSAPQEFVQSLSQELSELEKDCSNILVTL